MAWVRTDTQNARISPNGRTPWASAAGAGLDSEADSCMAAEPGQGSKQHVAPVNPKS